MERDNRRDRGQWRGCHTFKDIVCDGDTPSRATRDGALKMGHTYYFYYELDGATEMHDPSLPSTTTCPYLPGQKVNTMWVPVEASTRTRSASLSSVCTDDFKTVNPSHKFITPRPPAPPVPVSSSVRCGTAPVLAPIPTPTPLRHSRSSRSLSPSPTPSWSWSPRKLFTRKRASSRSDDDGTECGPEPQQLDGDIAVTTTFGSSLDAHSTSGSTKSEGSRSRDISPESLRRFLVEDGPTSFMTEPNELGGDRPAVLIPEDIAEENEMEDDDNFATSAVSESLPYTVLSPPPLQRGTSSSTTVIRLVAAAEEQLVGPAMETEAKEESASACYPEPPTRAPPELPMEAALLDFDVPSSHFSVSSASSVQSPDDLPSFYHSESEDEDCDDGELAQCKDDMEALSLPRLGQAGSSTEARSFEQSLLSAFSAHGYSYGYSLPRMSVEDSGSKNGAPPPAPVPQPMLVPVGSPALLARRDSARVPAGNASLLAEAAEASSPATSALDDLLVSELGWMADVIRGKATI